jgi:hypothetical protein
MIFVTVKTLTKHGFFCKSRAVSEVRDRMRLTCHNREGSLDEMAVSGTIQRIQGFFFSS